MGTRHRYRRLAVVAAALLIAASVCTSVAGAQPSPDLARQPEPAVPQVHEPPVDAPVIDPFRPPPQPWLPGNRGIEYGPTTGQTVRASAGGVVTFAGQVGGNLFVTVAHDSALRTTVGFLAEIHVAVGDAVMVGQPLAVAGDTLHFSARRNGIYIDPASLFQQYEVRVRLVS